jgi:hypothetical protein
MTNTTDSKSMSKSHTIQVPPGLMKQWIAEYTVTTGVTVSEYIADRAAQWGYDQREPELQQAADQELEAVKHWLTTGPYAAMIVTTVPDFVADLCADRRPKPPTLAGQGIEALDEVVDILRLKFPGAKGGVHIQTLTAALNRLAELEKRLKELELKDA